MGKEARHHEDLVGYRSFGLWVSIAILVVAFYLEDELNIILLSVALGTMFLGVWLKARFQLYQNREPEKQRPDEGEA